MGVRYVQATIRLEHPSIHTLTEDQLVTLAVIHVNDIQYVAPNGATITVVVNEAEDVDEMADREDFIQGEKDQP